MSSTTSKENRRPSTKPPASLGTKSRSPTRPAELTTTTPNATSRIRTGKSASSTPLSARAAAKRSSTIIPDSSNLQNEEDARMESVALVEELKSQLRKVELASEDYQKQIYILQAQCDEAIGEQSKLEDARNESLQTIEGLQDQQKEHLRTQKDLEKQLEMEKAASMREREEALLKEEELSGIIQRLKESLTQREHTNNSDGETRLSRTASFRGRSTAQVDKSPLGRDAVERRDGSQNSAKLIMQKDKLIESLRLELAEAQIRVMEVENAGGGRLQDLEKTLLETRIANAKLMEDNESYQVLLQEKTLNGDFSRFLRPPSIDERQSSSEATKRTSLAQELETAVVDPDIDVDSDTGHIRKLEAENASLKEQSKALTLYINNIITRLLQNDKFESLFDTTETEVGLENPSNPIGSANTNKSLPEPPAEEKETVTQSLLSRAGSVFGRQRPRPQSIQSQSNTTLTGSKSVNDSTLRSDSTETTPERRPSARSALPNPIENPLTAPSIPLKPAPSTVARHVRNSSSGSRPRPPFTETQQQHHASSIVNNMYRGPPPSSGGQLSPSGLASPRQTPFFAGPPPPPLFSDGSSLDGPSVPTSRVGSTSDPTSSAPSASETTSSPPRSAAASSSDAGPRSQTGGAIFGGGGSGNKMRPLRLVREKVEADEAAEAERKRNNRQSFMGWFSGMGGIIGQTQGGGQEAPEEERSRNVSGTSSVAAPGGVRKISEA